MIARTIAATARTTPKIWFLGHVCLLAPGAARPDLSKSNRERCVSSVTRCSDEIGQRWQPAVPSSFHFNCRLFWRTGDAVAGLIGARLKTLSASRGKRDGKGPLALRQPLPVQRVRLGRRIDVATGTFRTPVHPADGRRCRPTGRVSAQNTINGRFGRGCGKGTGRHSTARALHGLGWYPSGEDRGMTAGAGAAAAVRPRAWRQRFSSSRAAARRASGRCDR